MPSILVILTVQIFETVSDFVWFCFILEAI